MDDVTIEDEIDSNEQIFPTDQIKSSRNVFFQLLNEQWYILLLTSIVIFLVIYFFQKRKKNSNSPLNIPDNEDRYDQMTRIREQQQKAYEEQALRAAEQKKAKIESLKRNADEKSKPMKYRSTDHNPLTGQSNSRSSDSCSWRPSSKRKGPGG